MKIRSADAHGPLAAERCLSKKVISSAGLINDLEPPMQGVSLHMA